MSLADVRDLVPHSGPMLLLRRVVDHSPAATVCEVDTAASTLFLDADGRVPAWVGLEYMAQCAAAHGGLLARSAGVAPRPGMLLGTRRMTLAIDRFRAGQRLLISARCVHSGAQMLSFDSEIRDREADAILAAARLNIHLLDPLETNRT